MEKPDRLYPSIPEATRIDHSSDLEKVYRFWSDPCNGIAKGRLALIRVAAHHARRAAAAERKVAETQEKAKLAEVLERFDKWSARQKPPHFLECYGGVGWTLRCLESIRINLVSTTSLAGELTAWMDEQERKDTA